MMTLAAAIRSRGLDASLLGCPFAAELAGVPVKVTAVFDRTAVYEAPGRDIERDGRELARRDALLVAPEELWWHEEPERSLAQSRRRGQERGRIAYAANLMLGRRCPTCQRPLGRQNIRGICTNCNQKCACGGPKAHNSGMCRQCKYHSQRKQP